MERIPKGKVGMWKFTAVSCGINEYSSMVVAHSKAEAIRKIKKGTFDGDRVSNIRLEFYKLFDEGK